MSSVSPIGYYDKIGGTEPEGRGVDGDGIPDEGGGEAGPLTIENVDATTYSTVLADLNKLKNYTNPAGCLVTVTPSTLAVGEITYWHQDLGAGTITFQAAAGAVLRSSSGFISGGEDTKGAIIRLVNDEFTDEQQYLLTGELGILTAADISDFNAAVDARLGGKANIASPTFTGVPSAPTAPPATATTQIATTAFVAAAVEAGGGGGGGDTSTVIFGGNASSSFTSVTPIDGGLASSTYGA